MLNSLSRALAACMLLVCATFASAQSDPATAEQLMRGSGMWKQLEDIAPQMRAGLASAIAQGEPRVTPADAERIVRSAEAAFAADRLRAVARDVVARETDPADVPALQAWYASPVGAALTKMEVDASARDRDPEASMREGAAVLAKLPAARRARLTELIEVVRAAESMTNMAINVAIAIQLGAANAAPGAPGVSAAELRSALEAQRPQMVKAIAAQSLAMYARVYVGATDAALAAYISFLKSLPGSRFTEVAIRALDAALVDAAAEMGRGIAPGGGSKRT